MKTIRILSLVSFTLFATSTFAQNKGAKKVATPAPQQKLELVKVASLNTIESNQEFQKNVYYCLQISKSIQYRMINIVLSLAGENLGNDIVLVDNIITNEKKYSIDIRTTLQ